MPKFIYYPGISGYLPTTYLKTSANEEPASNGVLAMATDC